MKVINNSKPHPKFMKKELGLKKTKKGASKKEEKAEKSGVIFISHLPHGFYEQELKSYFSQFGKVLRVAVPRSENTGAIHGYGYVEFLVPGVAEVAAKSMNGYFVKGKLIKCEQVLSERVSEKMFPNEKYNAHNCPKARRREEAVKRMNKILNDNEKKEKMRKIRNKYAKKLEELEKEGVVVSLRGFPGRKHLLKVKKIQETTVDPNVKNKGPGNENMYLSRIRWFEKKFEEVKSSGTRLGFDMNNAQLEKIKTAAATGPVDEEQLNILKKQISFYKKHMKRLKAEGKISVNKPVEVEEKENVTESKESEMEKSEIIKNTLNGAAKSVKEKGEPLKAKQKKKRARKAKKPKIEKSETEDHQGGEVTLNGTAAEAETKEMDEPLTGKQKKKRGKKTKKAEKVNQNGSEDTLNGTSETESEKTQDNTVVVEVDESEDEIEFKTPPNVVKKFVKITPSSPATKSLTPEGKSTATEQSLVKSLFSKKKNLPATPSKAEDTLKVVTPQTVKLTPGAKRLGKKVKNEGTTPVDSKEETPVVAAVGVEVEGGTTPTLKKTPKKKAKTPGTPSASSASDQVSEEPVEAKTPKGAKTPVITPKKTPKKGAKVPVTPSTEQVTEEPLSSIASVEAKTPTAETPKAKTPKSTKRKAETEKSETETLPTTPLKKTVEEPQAKELFKKLKVDPAEQTTTPKKTTKTPQKNAKTPHTEEPVGSALPASKSEPTVEKTPKSPKSPKTPKVKIEDAKTPKSAKRKALDKNDTSAGDPTEQATTPAKTPKRTVKKTPKVDDSSLTPLRRSLRGGIKKDLS